MKKKNKEYKPSKWVYVIFFTLPLILILISFKKLDNDIWYLLSEGRYIVQKGLYSIDPLSMHSGLNVVVQNWLSASFFWLIYSAFGEMGLVFFVLLCNLAICYLLYKICYLISEKNAVLSLAIMLICNITLAAHYIVSRPQIISFILLLGVIYAYETYIKTDNGKYLIWLPIISLLQVNLHASLWWMIFLFSLPYVIDAFKVPILKMQGYRKKPIFKALLASFLVGFLNPYGYKAITFIFTSYGDKYMHKFISELTSFSFDNSLCIHMFIVILIISLISTFFRDGKVRIRYICLFCGTMLLGFMSVKGFNTFILVSMFPLAYFFSEMCPKDFSIFDEKLKNIINKVFATFAICLLGFFSFLVFITEPKAKLTHDAEAAMDVLERSFSPETSTVYTSFNYGGYVEFRGFKPYIDPRAELYIKKNNKKDDIFKEFYDLQHGSLNVTEFIKKYNFTHLLIKNTDYLYNNMLDQENYVIIYDDTTKGYRLYGRKDLFTSEQLKQIENSYSQIIDDAKEKSESTN